MPSVQEFEDETPTPGSGVVAAEKVADPRSAALAAIVILNALRTQLHTTTACEPVSVSYKDGDNGLDTATIRAALDIINDRLDSDKKLQLSEQSGRLIVSTPDDDAGKSTVTVHDLVHLDAAIAQDALKASGRSAPAAAKCSG